MALMRNGNRVISMPQPLDTYENHRLMGLVIKCQKKCCNNFWHSQL